MLWLEQKCEAVFTTFSALNNNMLEQDLWQEQSYTVVFLFYTKHNQTALSRAELIRKQKHCFVTVNSHPGVEGSPFGVRICEGLDELNG